MSEPRHVDVRLSPDVLSGPKVIGLLILTGVIATGFALWAVYLTHSQERQLAGLRNPPSPPTAPPRIMGVRQTPIEGPAEGQQLRAEQRQQLDSFGWADRSRGLVRIPIDEAMRLELQGGGTP